MRMKDDELRKCVKCNILKNSSGFGITGNSHRHVCKICVVARHNERYETDLNFRERTKQRHRDKYARHSSRYKENVQSYRDNNKNKTKETKRKQYLKKKILGIPRYISIRRNQPGKSLAQETVKHAIKNSVLIRPSICTKCHNEGNIEAHHCSYLKEDRLNIEWLCVKCHRDYHSKYFMRVILLDIDKVIYPYLATETNIKIFTEAVFAFPTLIKPKICNCVESDIYDKTFKFLSDLNGDFIYCKYGLIQKGIFGITTIGHIPHKTTLN